MFARFKQQMFRPINTSAVSIMGIFSVLWGFWVGNPWWNVFSSADMFSFMMFMPEWLWGGAAMLVGIAILYGVARNTYKPLHVGALSGFYFWMFVSLSEFVGDWQHPGGITLLIMSLYCGYVALNLFINRKAFEVESLIDQE